MAPRKKKTDPEIVELPPQKMAVVQGQGDLEEIFPKMMPALYGSVYTLKFTLKGQGLPTFKVSGLRGRYPDAHINPKDKWTVILGLPVPMDTTELPQKVPGAAVRLETWEYGTVGQILHIGPYDQEEPNINRLLGFITESGYEVTSPHEEEYLTSPDAKTIKTIIRYTVKRV